MPQELITSSLSALASHLQRSAHALVPAGSESFQGVAIVSLVGYLLFAIVALHYALKPWAEKAMLTSLMVATAASLLLHLSLRHSPLYRGEGALWKFVSLSQYLPWAVITLGVVYVLYRISKRCRP